MCRVTMGLLRLSIGYLKATVVHIRVTLGHLRVTIGNILRMDISFIHYLSHWSRCCNDAVCNSFEIKKIILRMDSSIIGQYQSLIQVILVRNKFVTMK